MYKSIIKRFYTLEIYKIICFVFSDTIVVYIVGNNLKYASFFFSDEMMVVGREGFMRR